VGGRLDYDRVALILVEALFFGDRPTAEKWGIHRRTIENYRKRLDDDSELVQIFQFKKEEFEGNWAQEIPVAIRKAIAFIGRSATEADPKDPQAIHAMAGAVKILAEVGLTKEIIDARLGRNDRPDREEDRQVVSGQIIETDQ
jgi:hypothetical protein